jgi:hypothetical protein
MLPPLNINKGLTFSFFNFGGGGDGFAGNLIQCSTTEIHS